MEKRRNLPGLTREAEEQNLQEIIQIAQNNLDHAKADIRKLNADLEDLLDVYDAQDKEGLALWNNATVRLHENEHNLVRYEKARKKPYFGRIDFKDPNAKEAESYYIGRVGIGRFRAGSAGLESADSLRLLREQSGPLPVCRQFRRNIYDRFETEAHIRN